MNNICPVCMAYMLDILDPILAKNGWKKCPVCGYCHDKDGKNELNKHLEKPIPILPKLKTK